MRRVLLYLLMLIVITGMAGACMGRIPAARQRSSQPAELANPPGFRMESQQAEYAADADRLRLAIYNDTDQDTMFGAAYALEVEGGGAWYDVPKKGVKPGTEPTWPAIAYQLPANGSTPVILDLSHHGNIEPGRYRVIKEIGPLSSGAEPLVVVAQFMVRQAEGSEPDQTTATRSGEPTVQTTRTSTDEGPARTSTASHSVQTTVSTTPTATGVLSDVWHASEPSSQSVRQGILSAAVPARCEALWNLKTAQTVGFTRKDASRQATWDCSATTLKLTVKPIAHEHFRAAEWNRSIENGIELDRQDTVTQYAVAKGASADTFHGAIYAKTLRMVSDTLSGTLSREAKSSNIRLAAVTLDQFRQLAADQAVLVQDAECRPAGERWTVRLQKERIDLSITLIPPPFDRAADLPWIWAAGTETCLDGAVKYRIRRQPETRDAPESVALAYPSGIGLIEVRGERLPRYGQNDPGASQDMGQELDFIDVNFVREIIARLH